MKVFNIGDKTEYGQIQLQIAKSQNKFGAMYYFEKIQLSSTSPIADYNTWKSKDGQNYLCIRHEPSLKAELDKIVETIMQCSDLKFKETDVAQIFFKIRPDLADSIPRNKNINVVLRIFGVFQQKNADLAYLQMEVIEVISC